MFKDKQEENFYREAIQSFYSSTDLEASYGEHIWKAGCDYTKEKLIAMGWTPPGEKQAAQVKPVGTKLYTGAPAVAVNEQMLAALKAAKLEIWRLLDSKSIDPKGISKWPEMVLVDAAIAAAEAAKGGV